jgi:hypothetical protein
VGRCQSNSQSEKAQEGQAANALICRRRKRKKSETDQYLKVVMWTKEEFKGHSEYLDSEDKTRRADFKHFSVLKNLQTEKRQISFAYYDAPNDTDYEGNLREIEKGKFEGGWSYREEVSSLPVTGDVNCTVTSHKSRLICKGTWYEINEKKIEWKFTWNLEKV